MPFFHGYLLFGLLYLLKLYEVRVIALIQKVDLYIYIDFAKLLCDKEGKYIYIDTLDCDGNYFFKEKIY